MRWSVALCTFNGARYLPEQLDSIARQSVLPGELVVCDDRSEDATLDVLREFAARARFPVRVMVNPVRLGVAANFGAALGQCSGDAIALADQDDVWHPAKLQRIQQVMARRPDARAVFTDAELVGPALKPLGVTLWESLGLRAREQARIGRGDALPLLARRSLVAGTTLAVRASLRDLALPVAQGWMHDYWLALLAAGTGGLVGIPELLVQYRQHGAQQIGARARRRQRRSVAGRLRTVPPGADSGFDFERWSLLADRLEAAAREGEPRAAGSAGFVRERVLHLRTRGQLPSAALRRLPLVWNELLCRRYQRHSNGVTSAVKDLMLKR